MTTQTEQKEVIKDINNSAAETGGRFARSIVVSGPKH